MVFRVLVAAALAVTSPVWAQDNPWDPPTTGLQLCLAGPRDQAEACLDREIKSETAHMEARYAQVMTALEKEEASRSPWSVGVDQLREVRVLWTAYRDADCAYYARTSLDARDARTCALGQLYIMLDAINALDVVIPYEDRDPRDRPLPQPPEDMEPTLPPKPAPGSCEARAKTEIDELNCTAQEVARHDARLNRVYRALMARLSDPGDKDALRKAQRAWIAYRDARCALEGGQGLGGQYYRLSCVGEWTEGRTGVLETFLGVPMRR